MYNFFVTDEQIKDNKVTIKGGDYNHIANVLRMKEKDRFFVCNKDNASSYLVEIQNIDKNEVICKIISENESSESKVNITIFQGIPKADKMEIIIQKAVELGVSNIYPVAMKNCVGRIKDENKKISRWQNISEASAKQSKRNIVPKIENQINIQELCKKIKEYDLSILAYENEKTLNLRQLLKKNKNINNLAIIIGPEGGFDEKEVTELEDAGAISCSIGKRILRCETASIALLSMIMYEFEF